MALTVYAHALTTLDRVKIRMGISVSTYDSALKQLINEATDFIQQYCSRRFLETTYTSEVYSGGDGMKTKLYLNAAPVTSISAFQERSGTPASATWTDIDTSNWEGENPQIAITNVQLAYVSRIGAIKTYFYLTAGVNNYRVTYVAGYKIDFGNEGTTGLTHTLPADLTGACEQMVVQMYNSRTTAGVQSESLGAHSVTWADLLTEKNGELNSVGQTLYRYKRPMYLD